MAKGDLGEYYSILGTAQQTRFSAQKKELEEERKRARRDRYLGYIAKPILGAIGEGVVDAVKTPFEEKYKDFQNTKFVVEQRAKDKTMRARAEAALAMQKKIYGDPRGELAFLQQDSFEALKQQKIEGDPDNAEFFNSGIADGQLREQSNAIAQERLAIIDRDFKAANAFLSSGTLDDSLRNRRSKNALQGFIDVFQRDTTEKQDERAENDFLKTTYAKDRNAYETYLEAKESGASVVSAYKDAKLVLKEATGLKDYYADFTVEQREYREDVNGNAVETVVVETYNRRSEQWKRNKGAVFKSTKPSETLTEATVANRELELVRKANVVFNPLAQARQHFTPEAIASFKTYIKDRDPNISITNPQTLEDRKIILEAFDALDSEENLKSTASKAERAASRKAELKSRIIAGDMTFNNAFTAYQEALKFPAETVMWNNEKQTLAQITIIYARQVQNCYHLNSFRIVQKSQFVYFGCANYHHLCRTGSKN